MDQVTLTRSRRSGQASIRSRTRASLARYTSPTLTWSYLARSKVSGSNTYRTHVAGHSGHQHEEVRAWNWLAMP